MRDRERDRKIEGETEDEVLEKDLVHSVFGRRCQYKALACSDPVPVYTTACKATLDYGLCCVYPICQGCQWISSEKHTGALWPHIEVRTNTCSTIGLCFFFSC